MRTTVLILILLFSPLTFPCDCLPPEIKDSFYKSEFIASGSVVFVTSISSAEKVGYFVPKEIFKGKSSIDFQVVSTEGPCSGTLELGEYLVYASSSRARIWTCSASYKIATHNKASVNYELNYLRSLSDLSSGKKSNFITRLSYKEFRETLKPYEREIALIYKRLSKTKNSKSYTYFSVVIDESGVFRKIVFPEEPDGNSSLNIEMLKFLNGIKFRKIAEEINFNLYFEKA